jgi:hypothetical protein
MCSCSGTEQVPLDKISHTSAVESTARLRSKSLDLISAVHQYLDRQGDTFSSLREIFVKYAASCSVSVGDTAQEQSHRDDGLDPGSKSKLKEIMKIDGLQHALLELGVPMEKTEAYKLMLKMDLDEKGVLDFEEFKRAVEQPSSQLEQWASMLPLAGILARSLPVSGEQNDKPLRDFSKLGEDEINTAVEVFSEGLKLLLMQG